MISKCFNFFPEIGRFKFFVSLKIQIHIFIQVQIFICLQNFGEGFKKKNQLKKRTKMI